MASTLLMVEPNHFGFNEQTSSSNSFQKKKEGADVTINAMKEFQEAVDLFRKNGIQILTFPSPVHSNCPDAVFPNNWFSTHENGTLILYPMLTPNRRSERNQDIILYLQSHFNVSEKLDLSKHEENNEILEGTGSIVFDHENKWAYACISPRTNEKLLDIVCQKLQYTPIVFEATDLSGNPIYHTNVVMGIGKKYVIICLDCIENSMEKAMIKEKIKASNKELIEISQEQMNHFAGNVLEVENNQGEPILILSKTAYESLLPAQKTQLSHYSQLLALEIPTIETIGGGSARCMLAEIRFAPKIP